MTQKYHSKWNLLSAYIPFPLGEHYSNSTRKMCSVMWKTHQLWMLLLFKQWDVISLIKPKIWNITLKKNPFFYNLSEHLRLWEPYKGFKLHNQEFTLHNLTFFFYPPPPVHYHSWDYLMWNNCCVMRKRRNVGLWFQRPPARSAVPASRGAAGNVLLLVSECITARLAPSRSTRHSRRVKRNKSLFF